MKKYYFYLLILIATSCKNTSMESANKVNVADSLIDSSNISLNPQNLSLQKKVYHSNMVRKDSIVDDYSISYIIQDNDDVITTYPISDGKGLDTIYYAGREILLDIKYKGEDYFYQKINRELFTSYLPVIDIKNVAISYFNLEGINGEDNKLIFNISLCVPDTDVCYWFVINITNRKDIEIKELILDEEDF